MGRLGNWPLHSVQDKARLATRRASRDLLLACARSSGTFVPDPKNTSSGVCPRNAECGIFVLCSSTWISTNA